jgi:hypothetical protein
MLLALGEHRLRRRQLAVTRTCSDATPASPQLEVMAAEQAGESAANGPRNGSMRADVPRFVSTRAAECAPRASVTPDGPRSASRREWHHGETRTRGPSRRYC